MCILKLHLSSYNICGEPPTETCTCMGYTKRLILQWIGSTPMGWNSYYALPIFLLLSSALNLFYIQLTSQSNACFGRPLPASHTLHETEDLLILRCPACTCRSRKLQVPWDEFIPKSLPGLWKPLEDCLRIAWQSLATELVFAARVVWYSYRK